MEGSCAQAESGGLAVGRAILPDRISDLHPCGVGPSPLASTIPINWRRVGIEARTIRVGSCPD